MRRLFAELTPEGTKFKSLSAIRWSLEIVPLSNPYSFETVPIFRVDWPKHGDIRSKIGYVSQSLQTIYDSIRRPLSISCNRFPNTLKISKLFQASTTDERYFNYQSTVVYWSGCNMTWCYTVGISRQELKFQLDTTKWPRLQPRYRNEDSMLVSYEDSKYVRGLRTLKKLEFYHRRKSVFPAVLELKEGCMGFHAEWLTTSL